MKKLKGLLVLILLLTLLACPIAVLASDISGALYYGTIIVSNNGTAATNVAVNCTISTQSLIDGGYLNSTANNCVIRSSSGADLPFMPGLTDDPWTWFIWVPSIGQDSHLSDILYTAESTGGKIRYFPGSGGMTSIDSATLEPGDNFTITQNGWWNTDNGTDKDATIKAYTTGNLTYNTFRVYVSDTEQITAEIINYVSFNATASSGYIRKVAEATWDLAHDAAAGTQAHANTVIAARAVRSAPDNWSIYRGYLFFDTTPLPPGTTVIKSTLLMHLFGQTGADGDPYADTHIVEGVQHDPLVVNDYGDQLLKTTSGGVIAYDDIVAGWNAMELNATGMGWIDDAGTTLFCTRLWGDIDDIEPTGENYIRFNGPDVAGRVAQLFVATDATSKIISASNVPSGEHTVTVSANITHFWIDIDGATENITALGGVSIPDSTNDWTFLQNDVVMYGGADNSTIQKFWIDGVLQQEIEHEYTDNYTDQSGNSHWAIPSFRTGTSDPDVSAVFSSFLPISEAKAPSYALSDAPDFIETVPSIVSVFDTTPPTGGFPLADVITAVANATATPPQLPLLIIAGFVIIAFSFLLSATMRRYGSGTIIVKIIAITAVMGVFIALKNFGIDFWMLVIFLMIAVALAMASRQATWN